MLDLLPALPHRPGAHVPSHASPVEPPTPKRPCGQLLQLAKPICEYLPALHFVQCTFFPPTLNMPAAQGAQNGVLPDLSRR